MSGMIKVLLVPPQERPRLVTVEHTLENLQGLVGGYLQALYPFNDPVAIVADEEGMINQKPANRVLRAADGKAYDFLKGTFFICGLGEEDFTSLSNELAEKYMEMYREPEYFLRVKGGHVMMLKGDAPPEMII